MAKLNNYVCIGNIVFDPELKKTSTGKSVCNIRLAIAGRTDKDTVFIDARTWEKTAEFVCGNATKGSPLLVVGELAVDSYTDKTGKNQSRLYINAQRVETLAPKKSEPAVVRESDFERVVDDDGLPF